jgi:hypothetical protein
MKDSITLRDDVAAMIYANMVTIHTVERNFEYGNHKDPQLAAEALARADTFVRIRNADPVYKEANKLPEFTGFR